jgi:F420-dependent oxidoreductase-like protein
MRAQTRIIHHRQGASPMRPFFGFHMPDHTFPDSPPEGLFDRVVELARAAEAAGFDLVTVMDHFYQIPPIGAETEPMLEAYTTLGALAASTSRVRLATLVTGVTYRNPALVAKMVTTLDVISKGRAVCGLGAAWNESEHRGYGFEFPPIGERMDRLEEALAICRLLFTEERPSFEGRHYRIEDALNVPRPIQPGGPPIMVGGGGEKRTLRLVARYADISNFAGHLEDVAPKLDVLARHCEAEGRDPTSILRTVTMPVALVERPGDGAAALARLRGTRRADTIALTPAQCADRLNDYLAAGFGGFMFRNATLPTPASLDLAAEVIRLMS